METSNPCLIEQQLTNIKASALSANEIEILFRSLKEILTSLVSNPFDENAKIISKDSDLFMNGLTRVHEVQDILNILGFHEENERYVHHISDENLMKVESCLNLLTIFNINQEMCSPSSELSDEEVQEGFARDIASKKARSLPDLGFRNPEERASSLVKKLILSRHMKKEENKERTFSLRSSAASSQKESPSVTFNANGYFHQCCSSRSQKKDRSAIADFFHKQDSRNKRWSVSGFNKVI